MKILSEIIPIIKNNLSEILALRQKKVKKEDDSYVSEGDLLLDRIIYDFINSRFDNYLLISEETFSGKEVDASAYRYLVVVDPIDGTENFVSGLKEWGVGISIYKNGVHLESLIGLPELDEYILTGDKFMKFNSRIAGLSSSLNKQQLLSLEEGYEYRIIGCCMYNMLQVVKGAYATFENPKGANSWDILPGLNLALENNLEIVINNKKYNGEFLQPTQKYCFKIRNV
ncbi:MULTISPECIES: inositol monophosphatase family protein [Sphingobacterium]|uniref:inositol monophosphatase family protein n=1 Tax=Sphingobacterium TaxID=28453 RepID=UPI0028AB1097|nr:inositol monophosphatase family protein [Sphingobacterium multivorum]